MMPGKSDRRATPDEPRLSTDAARRRRPRPLRRGVLWLSIAICVVSLLAGGISAVRSFNWVNSEGSLGFGASGGVGWIGWRTSPIRVDRNTSVTARGFRISVSQDSFAFQADFSWEAWTSILKTMPEIRKVDDAKFIACPLPFSFALFGLLAAGLWWMGRVQARRAMAAEQGA